MTVSTYTQPDKASILLIYTGGTIGMIENPETGVLESFNFQHLKDNMPELKSWVIQSRPFSLIPRWIHRKWALSPGKTWRIL